MLIGVTGKARSGKNTFSDMLGAELNYQVLGLADKLKYIVNQIMGWDERHSFGALKEEKVYSRVVHTSQVAMILNHCWGGLVDIDIEKHRRFFDIFQPYVVFDNLGFIQWEMSPRKAYQLFGTEYARAALYENIWIDFASKEDTIWTDVRFDNEAKAVKDLGGLLIRIESDRETIAEAGHKSGAGVDPNLIDVIIKNNGTRKQLKKEAEVLAKAIRKM